MSLTAPANSPFTVVTHCFIYSMQPHQIATHQKFAATTTDRHRFELHLDHLDLEVCKILIVTENSWYRRALEFSLVIVMITGRYDIYIYIQASMFNLWPQLVEMLEKRKHGDQREEKTTKEPMCLGCCRDRPN